MLAIAQIETLCADGGGDNGAANTERLGDLQPRAAADAQRHHLEPGALIVGTDVGNLAGDGDAREFAERAHGGCRVLAHDEDAAVGHGGEQGGVGVREIPLQSVDVGRVVHRAAEQHRRRRIGPRGEAVEREVIRVYPIREHEDGRGGIHLAAQEGLVIGPAHHGGGEFARGGALEAAEFPEVLAAQHPVAPAEAQVGEFLLLEQQVHAAAIHDARRLRRQGAEVRPENEVDEVGQIVGLAGGETVERGLHAGLPPMGDRGGQRLEQALREKARPRRMAERVKLHACAEFPEDRVVVRVGVAF